MKLLKNFDPLSVRLIFIASLSGLIYLFVFTLPFPLTQLYRTIPPVDYAKLTGYSLAGFVAYVLGLGVLFGLYIWAIRLNMPSYSGRQSAVGGRLIFRSSALLAAILIFSYPLTAIDLFIYAIRTRGWALYGLNPLATPPSALPTTDPWLGLAAEWVDAPSPYGPAWEILSRAAFYLSGGDFLFHLLALKVVGLLAYLGCTWLVYQILRRMQPEWAAAGAIAFAWNPLTLLEGIQNAHNDGVMVFFLLAAVWVLNGGISESANQRNVPARHSPFAHSLIRHSLVCLLLALSILVKFITALVVPFFLLAMISQQANWRVQLLQIGGYGFLTSGLVIGFMWPLWPGWDKWAVVQAGGQAGRSLLALLILAFKDVWGVNFTFDLFRNLIYLIFGGIYLFYLWKIVRSGHWSVVSSQNLATWQLGNLATLLYASFHALFWYVFLVAPVFHAWYLLWFLPLAALLLPQPRPLMAAVVFSITALLVIPYFETIRVWYPVLLQNQLLGHVLGVPLLLIPPVLALWGWLSIQRFPDSAN
ncbi:MAG: hypothetical protein U0401_15425 [Anaerolineae bacterium]